jgi:hypothetical protein
MLEYLTESRVCSIYRALERWPVNLKETHGGQRGGVLAYAIGGNYRGKLQAITGWAIMSHCGVVKVPRHVAQGREVSNSGEGRSKATGAKRTRQPE